MPKTFKEQHPELQILVWEWHEIRAENEKRRLLGPMAPQELLMAEMAVDVIIMETFLRIVAPGAGGEQAHGLYLLIVAKWPQLAALFTEKDLLEYQLRRNAFLHGNFQQRADQLKIAATAEYSAAVLYFRSGAFVKDLRTVEDLTDKFLSLIDTTTGEPKK